jgi:hypothetical protein
MTTVLLVEKLGTIKPLKIKEYNEEEFYKKCGYKSSTNFKRQHTWHVKANGTNYWVSLFAKSDVKNALGENKYEFPPPVDSVLYFGTCLLAAYSNNPNGLSTSQPVNLSVDLWTEMYNKLYGGFENLAATAEIDEQEYDELDNVPAHKKTKDGYLKDGFVVDEKQKKVKTDNNSVASKTKKSATVTQSARKIDSILPNVRKNVTSSLLDNEQSEEDTNEDDEVSTVYTDIDEDDDDLMSSGGGGGLSSSKKKKKSSKKKDFSKGDANIEMTINDLLITDELKEEPYIE